MLIKTKDNRYCKGCMELDVIEMYLVQLKSYQPGRHLHCLTSTMETPKLCDKSVQG